MYLYINLDKLEQIAQITAIKKSIHLFIVALSPH